MSFQLNPPDKLMNLNGKRIVVSAYDLEQIEHRGIAVYTKALIRTLKSAGAEVWLLTEFDLPIRGSGLRALPVTTKEIVQSAKVLESLSKGTIRRSTNFLESKIGLVRKIAKFLDKIDYIIEFIKRPRYYPRSKIKEIRLHDLFDNPYLRHDRLGYLQDVEGLLCARKVFFSTHFAALLKKQRPVVIDLKGFDSFITAQPLNIRPINVTTFAQTVHDIIPLEYALTLDHTLVFSHRLQACLSSRRIFVSEATALKFKERIHHEKRNLIAKRIENFQEEKEKVFVQPPSLTFPNWLTEDSKSVTDLKPVTHLFRPNHKDGLIPFRYFLFNSSVEARKNLLFLVKAYAESNLGSKGIRLCVTGKLKKDSYSQAVKQIVKHEPGVVLTGYISDSAKLDLYLNAMSLLSPSLAEGFGIPVLDSACLGMAGIASNCESHREIQAMHDFKENIHLVNTIESRDWAIAMQSVEGTLSSLASDPSKERRRRIARYSQKSKLLSLQFQQDLCEFLL